MNRVVVGELAVPAATAGCDHWLLCAAAGADVSFVFGDGIWEEHTHSCNYTAAELQLAADTNGAIAAFAATGDPSQPGLRWLEYGQEQSIMQLDVPPFGGQRPGLNSRRREFCHFAGAPLSLCQVFQQG